MSIFLNVNVSTTDGGLIQSATNLTSSATGGAALVDGTVTTVLAASLTTSGSGELPTNIQVTVTGGVIASILTGGDAEGWSVGDTITIPVAASGGAGESQWGSDIVITLTASNIILGQATQKIPLDDFGCVHPQISANDDVHIDLLRGGYTSNYKITFMGIENSNDLDTGWAVAQACQEALQSTSDVTLNGYLPGGVTPVQVTYELA